MKQQLIEELLPSHVTCYFRCVNVEKVIILLESEKGCWTNRVVKLPPDNVTICVLGTIDIRVAVGSNGVCVAWGVCGRGVVDRFVSLVRLNMVSRNRQSNYDVNSP
jgi:hypothetical protein